MPENLVLHAFPGHAAMSAVDGLTVCCQRQSADGALLLDYRLTADLPALCIPALQAPLAVDGLWRHTCFEVFVAGDGEPAYREFNFSPSRQWAAYAFSGYRQRLASWAWPMDAAVPGISVHSDAGCLRLEVRLEAACLPAACRMPWRIGLSAVIEDAAGRCSYWALAHPAAAPDFHHPEAFTLILNS